MYSKLETFEYSIYEHIQKKTFLNDLQGNNSVTHT